MYCVLPPLFVLKDVLFSLFCEMGTQLHSANRVYQPFKVNPLSGVTRDGFVQKYGTSKSSGSYFLSFNMAMNAGPAFSDQIFWESPSGGLVNIACFPSISWDDPDMSNRFGVSHPVDPSIIQHHPKKNQMMLNFYPHIPSYSIILHHIPMLLDIVGEPISWPCKVPRRTFVMAVPVILP